MKIGILGYGNLGRGVECAIKQNPDMELAAVFTRRAPETVSILTEGAAVCSVDDVEQWKDKIDVMILCGGSATDLPEQTPKYAKMFNVVDSFDTHARIPEHFENVDKSAKESGHVGIISVGWDPGMFSLNRMYANAILPEGRDYTFWGKGVSQLCNSVRVGRYIFMKQLAVLRLFIDAFSYSAEHTSLCQSVQSSSDRFLISNIREIGVHKNCAIDCGSNSLLYLL